MKRSRLAGALLIACAIAAHAVLPVRVYADAADVDAPLFRIFLKDGTTLVSYGELARIDDRTVFSMPTSASPSNPELQLVTIPSAAVDWQRTDNYADAARAKRYLALRAEDDYAKLTTQIAQMLTQLAVTDDPAARLIAVENARKLLADWPASHFNYNVDEIRQWLALLDEAIADLRAAAGVGQFSLSFVAAPAAAIIPSEPLLPPPTPKEAIEQTLMAARVTTSPAERVSLLAVALRSLDRDAALLPPEWSITARIEAKSAIAREVAVDESYRVLTARMSSAAAARARAADVRGVQRLLDDIQLRDAALGHARSDTVNALIAVVQEQLDAARRLQLAHDRWAIRLPALQRYRVSITRVLPRLWALKPTLEDIKSLAGSTPEALDALQRTARAIGRTTSLIEAPEEFRSAHALVASATELAMNAATIRREAALAGNIARAWDASSAAAGALMLLARAQSELDSIFQATHLPR